MGSENLDRAIDTIDYWLEVWREADEINAQFPEDIRDQCNWLDGDTGTQLRQLTVTLAQLSDQTRAEIVAQLRCIRRELVARYVRITQPQRTG